MKDLKSDLYRHLFVGLMAIEDLDILIYKFSYKP